MNVFSWLKHKKIHLMMLGGIILIASLASSGKIEMPKKKEPAVWCVGAQAGDFQCYKKYYEVLTTNAGAPVALKDITAAYATSSFIMSQCHQLTHVIGNTAYENTGSIAKAFVEGDSFCWSGYYHGVVERAVSSKGSAYIKEHLNEFCSEMPGKERYSFDYYNCVHGLGHGVMSMTRNELFESLRLCDLLTGDWEKSSCYGGVYMENVMADWKNHKTAYLKKDDLLYPCTAVEERYKYQCYLMQTSYVLKENGYDFADAFKRCDAVPAPFNEVCAQSIGRDASGSTISNAAETKKRCDLAPNPLLYHNCIVGAVKDFVSYFHSDGQARQFCAMLEKGEDESCDALVTSYYSTFAR
jgi:hypothetical protein